MERAPKLWMMMMRMMCGKETNWINRKVVASYHKSEWDIQIISNIPDVQRFWIFYVFAKGMAMWTQYLCIRWRKFPKLIKSLICVYKNVHDFQTQFSLSQSNFLQLFESSLIISLLPNKRKPSKETFVGPFHCFSIDFWISIKGDKEVKYWPGIESAAKKHYWPANVFLPQRVGIPKWRHIL